MVVCVGGGGSQFVRNVKEGLNIFLRYFGLSISLTFFDKRKIYALGKEEDVRWTDG